MLTYGDGVSDVDIHDLIDTHKSKPGKAVVTMTAIHAGLFAAVWQGQFTVPEPFLKDGLILWNVLTCW